MLVQESVALGAAMPLRARIALMLLAMMSSIPFLIPHHLNPITSFFNEWVAVALGLLATASLLLSPRSWQPLRVPLITLVPLALGLIAALQVATGKSVYWQHHMLVGLYLLWATLMMVLGSVLKEEVGLGRVAPVLAWALVLAGIVSAAIVGFQVAGIESAWIMAISGKQYSANLGQANHLANLLGLALASLAYLGVTRRLPVSIAAPAGTVLLAALALTGSRSGWLYLGILLVLALFWCRRQPQGRGIPLVVTAVAAFMAFAALQLLIPALLADHAPLMPAEKVVAAAEGGSVRLQLLEVAWRTFLTSPWLGVGFGQFAWNDFLLAEAIQHNAGRTTHAHNLFAHLLAETGVAGLLVVVGGFATWLWRSRQSTWSSERWWMLTLLGVMFVHSLLEYPLWYAYFLGLAAFLLGAADEKPREFRFSPGPVVGLAMTAFGVFCLANIGQQYLHIERWYQMGRKQLAAEAVERLPDMRRRGLLTPYLDHVLVRILPDSPQFLHDKLVLNTRVIRFLPDRQDVYQHAALLAHNGHMEEARVQLRRALARHPEEANRFAVKLLRSQSTATMPLVMMALQFDLKRRPVAGLKVRNPLTEK